MANKGWFQEGHPNYYTGKKIDAKKFLEAYNRYARKEITKEQCAKEIGISKMTLNKHLSTFWTTGELRGIFVNPDDFLALAPMA